MENPYQSPAPTSNPWSQDVAGESAAAGSSRLVHHVIPIAILLMVHGALLVVASLLSFGMAIFYRFFVSIAEVQGQIPQEDVAQMDSMMWMVTVVYGLAGVATFFPGGLQIIAGVRNLRFKGRTLGIVAVSTGMLTLATVCCALPAIGLLVYGLIVYLNADVARAFQMGEQGYSVSEIRGAFP